MSDPYSWANSGVLRNLLGIEDRNRLHEAEVIVSMAQTSRITTVEPVPGDLDFQHLRAIHRALLSEIYEWAGQPRIPGHGLRKFGPSPDSIRRGDYEAFDMYSYEYLIAGPEVDRVSEEALKRFRSETSSEMPKADFVPELARAWGDVNWAHAFREGNTRSQVVLFYYACQRQGRDLAIERFTEDPDFRTTFSMARFLYQETGDRSLLDETLSRLLM